MEKFETKLGESKLTIETGKMAQLASGSVTVTVGETVVLATAVVSNTPKENIDYFPLLVDFEERMYASGKISGSRFIKREGRSSENAILTSRLIDRPLRPLFPKGFYNDVQIIITVLSADLIHDPDVIAIIAASSALTLAGAPFDGPVGAVRVGLVDDKLVLNPSYEEIGTTSQLDLIVAGTKDKVLMVEASASEVSEEKMIEAIEFAHKALGPTIVIQEEMMSKLSNKKEYAFELPADQLVDEITKFIGDKANEALYNPEKTKRNEMMDALREAVKQQFVTEENSERIVSEVFSSVISQEFRKNILENEKRPDGRKIDEIRPISCEIKILPRPHGSALFTRGETQALTTVTLGSVSDEQMIDTMDSDTTKRYMHHYNFPPYSVGEIKPMRGPSRRDIGHGSLAERALFPTIPSKDDFPYTIRVVSEILASNGSSSMAAVCGSTLSLMDAGVPITKPVAGIAMGVVIGEGNTHKVLTDIAGVEDYNGDMDFKVAGTKDGITALQLDTKVHGLNVSILQESFSRAKIARLEILKNITDCISSPRPELSMYAPRVTMLKIDPDKIRDVIGPGGKIINEIIDRAGGKGVTEINIEDDGTVYVSSTNAAYTESAVSEIKNITREVQAGERFTGKVTRIMDFGAFVEIFPGTEGLVHISELADRRVDKVTDVVKVGDILPVIVKEIDNMGRLNLSHKGTLNKSQEPPKE
ncbi:polyribonucleotide nucleotidyltransferase [Patescibacteria group bacterium]|nr:polyribonucleotide nucleotidyltransferase [Patescibacteria group bacterium]